jgi:signal transduction histidine kinase
MRFILATITFLVAFTTTPSFAQRLINYNEAGHNISIGKDVELLEDKNSSLTPEQAIASKDFMYKEQAVPNLQITPTTWWVRFTIKNNTSDMLAMELAYATIDSVTLYTLQPGNTFTKMATGEYVPYYERSYKHQNYIFDLDIPQNDSRTYLLRVNASEQCQLPLTIGTSKSIEETLSNGDLIFGIYAGIILVMFLYNIFIFFTVREKTYLLYVVYILFVGLTQACVQGYATRFFYPASPLLANFMLVLSPSILGISALQFLKDFMNVKKYTPTLFKVLRIFEIAYLVIITMGILHMYRLAANLVQINAGVASIFVMIIAIKIMRMGYKPAAFFLLAWSIFLTSVIVFILRNFNVLPYNNYTYYALQIGSALEIVLLSFALADKISILRKEKEVSQAQTLSALQENERIIREQNVMLERKVDERTYELKLSNDDLNKAMTELKEAETQLVESEKMASLGQLTAGIAHEINNPINFVTSNVKPLNRDVLMLIDMVAELEKVVAEDSSIADKQKKISVYKNDIDYDYLKEEIEQLLSGIGEGASRTAEIVKGLRIFSRLDEDDLKKADINEGIESTLVLTNNLLNNTIKVEKKLGNLPLIECYPGKLNQVFLNMISNAIYAIKKQFGEKDGGLLTIATECDENNVFIRITDNGTGMDENTKKRLFEPFFTTKDVGEGTGLGLSISYNTIIKHSGQIQVNSEIGKGTEFVLILPLIQK